MPGQLSETLLEALRGVLSWGCSDDELISLLAGFEEYHGDMIFERELTHAMDTETVSCQCEDDCGVDADCECVESFGHFYSPHGLLDTTALPLPLPLVECGQHCACNNEYCRNRATQEAITCDLELCKTSRGLGLFTTSPIPAGKFICLYAGEHIQSEEAATRWRTKLENGDNVNYILSLRENGRSIGHIDPTRKGNIGRFINHSCKPSCVVELVRWGATAQPRPAIFAKCRLAAGEELTYDYGNASGEVEGDSTMADLEHGVRENVNRTPCLCGSSRCRGYMPYDETLASSYP